MFNLYQSHDNKSFLYVLESLIIGLGVNTILTNTIRESNPKRVIT